MATITRNEKGLLDGVEYKYNPDSSINWRAMVDPKYLYVNTDNFQKRGEKVPESIDGVSDRDLIIQLPGLRELAYLRGFTSVSYRPIIATNEFAATVCRIEWIPNFESNMQPVAFESMANANCYNTSEMTQSYLLEMSENRSFCRAVRNFLRIYVVSKDELPPPKKKSQNGAVSKLNPSTVLADYMKGKGRTFEETKKKLVAEGCKEFENYKDWSDVPGDTAFNLLERFKSLRDVKR